MRRKIPHHAARNGKGKRGDGRSAGDPPASGRTHHVWPVAPARTAHAVRLRPMAMVAH